MNFGYREDCLEHDPGPRHPESPDRLRAIKRALADRHGVDYVAAENATLEAITTVHGEEYVESLEAFCEDGGGSWDADTTANEATWEAALASAGLGVWAAEEALAGADGRETPFSIGRPPGHHAVPDDAMGFCFFNNVAIATEAALAAGADSVAIFDWDVHHGNGTQDVFYDRDDVLFASIHEDGLYPGTGALDEDGTGDGEGTTINLPLPPGAETQGYLAALEDLIGPQITAFDPDLLLVSAGFDAHEHDPISRMRVSTEGYGLLTERVRELAESVDAGLGFILEGGYGLDTLSSSVRTVHEVFDGYQPEAPDAEPTDAVSDRIAAAVDQAEGS